MRGVVRTVVAVTFLVAGAACSSGSSAPPPGSGADPSFAKQPAEVSPQPLTTTTPSPTAAKTTTTASKSAPPPEPAVYCRTSELDVSVGQGDAAMGHVEVPLLFRNRSDRSCALKGYPGVAGLDDSGRQVIQAKRSQQGYFVNRPGATPMSVSLGPGQTASAELEGNNRTADGANACSAPRRMLVTPPNETHSVVVERALPGCRNVLIHPVVPGSTGS